MKLYDKPVEMIKNQDKPIRYRWRGQWLTIDHIESTWNSQGPWWMSAADRATYYCVALADQAMVELFWSPKEKKWYLHKVYD